MSRRLACFALLTAFFVSSSTGCIDRRFVIETDPPGSIVTVNGKLVGPTPNDVPFTYYGTYRFVFQRDGYETLTVDEKISSPWYEYFPIEFVTENLLPFTVRDIRYIRKPLLPMVVIPPETILQRSGVLREQGKTIGACQPGAVVGVPVPGPGAPVLPAPRTLPPRASTTEGVLPPPPPPPPPPTMGQPQ